MPDLPTGTVTFLFTDVGGSTTLAQQFPAQLPAFLVRLPVALILIEPNAGGT